MSKRWALGLIAFALAGCGLGLTAVLDPAEPQPMLERVRLIAGPASLDAEVARTPEQIRRGLMYRQSLLEGRGMLFVLDRPQSTCFWMKNTLVPLTAAFLDAGGRILNLADMQPLSEQLHCSKGDALYVVEAPQGWFQRQGVGPGDAITTAAKFSP